MLIRSQTKERVRNNPYVHIYTYDIRPSIGGLPLRQYNFGGVENYLYTSERNGRADSFHRTTRMYNSHARYVFDLTIEEVLNEDTNSD